MRYVLFVIRFAVEYVKLICLAFALLFVMLIGLVFLLFSLPFGPDFLRLQRSQIRDAFKQTWPMFRRAFHVQVFQPNHSSTGDPE